MLPLYNHMDLMYIMLRSLIVLSSFLNQCPTLMEKCLCPEVEHALSVAMGKSGLAGENQQQQHPRQLKTVALELHWRPLRWLSVCVCVSDCACVRA